MTERVNDRATALVVCSRARDAADARLLLEALGVLEDTAAVTHACPGIGETTTPCCDRTPLSLPSTDRLTLFRHLVTCEHGAPGR